MVVDLIKGHRSRPFFSPFKFKNKDNLEDEGAKYPDDCYSFIAQGWVDNKAPLAYGLLVFLFQISFLLLMICSKMNRKMSADEDNDNPSTDGFAAFMPANAALIVKTTQFLSIMAFLVFADESIKDVANAVRYFPLPVWSEKNLLNWFKDNIWTALACVLRFTQGSFACFTVFLLVMTSTDVIEIVLNFTAVNQISNFDDSAFTLAISGKYGDVLKKKATDIKEKITLDYRCLDHLKDEKVSAATKDGKEEEELHDIVPAAMKDGLPAAEVEPNVTFDMYAGDDEEGNEEGTQFDIKYKWYIPTVFCVACLVLGFSSYVAIKQSLPEVWEAQQFRVEFDEETGLLDYSGCYNNTSTYNDRRVIYKSQDRSAGFRYCKESRRWVFYNDDNEDGDPCNETGDDSNKARARSSKTNSFDVSTAFELNWVSMYNKPLEMYFHDINNDLFCDQFANNGICDRDLNNYDFQYDGGDCCGTTCSKPDSCGKNTSFEAFGETFNESFTNDAIGYGNCTEPGKVHLTVNLPPFTDKPPDDLKKWIDFWSPRLKLECGEEESRTVFAITVSESMSGKSYSNIAVESDSVCSLIASNFEPLFGSLDVELSAANISIDGSDTVDVVPKNTIPIEFVSLENRAALVFTGNYNLEGTIPTEIGSMTSLKEVNLAKNKLEGTLPTEIGNLELLTNLVLDNNRLTGSIPSEVLSLLDMTTLVLDNNKLTGTIPTEIGLLTKLTFLDLHENSLTGRVPSEINELSNLKYLNLSGNNLKGSVDCSNFNDILNEELCRTLNSFPRWDSESPTTSSAPSDAPSVSNAPSFSPSVSNAPSVSFSPSVSNAPSASSAPSHAPSVSNAPSF